MRKVLCLLSLCLCSIAVLAESAAGVRWTAPAGWKIEGARPMRAATYTIAPEAGDKVSSECSVYFFGAGEGGPVDANIERWKGQFSGPDGKEVPAKAVKRTNKGLPITTIDISGEYSGMGGPMAAAPRAVAGYRLLGAIIEGPGGNVFVKFTGPARTIAANRQKFEMLLTSFQPDR